MFEYTLPCGGFKTHTIMTENNIKFDPPVFEQRYCTVVQILEDQKWLNEIKKVTEFGCAEMRLFQLIRRIGSIEHIVQVDIDEALLTTHLSRTDPLVSDYMRQRESPLHVDVFHGSVADSSAELLNTDVVIALELIEHVYDDVLSKIPHNIFGYMHPKIVIISTPNADFNVIFTRFSPLLPNGFRHHDHKFEWTRAEFKAWCLDITEKYPNYMCSIFGVGEAPAGDESVGNVSQIALFVRKDLLDMPLVEPFNAQPEANCETPYRNLHSVDFPFFKDTRTTEEKIWTQVQYELHRATYREDYYDADRYVYKIAIAEILRCVEYLGATAEILQQLLLENKKQMENGYVIIEEDNYSSDHDSHDYSQDAQEQVEDANCTNEVENWDA